MAVKGMTASIAMATHNGRAFVEEQLHSFATQSRLPDELIVSDDCSDDGTIELVTHFARTAPFEVRVQVNERRLGYAQNFAIALGACTGDVVLLSDQDDVWMAGKVERVVTEFEKNSGTGLLVHDCVITDKHLVHSGTTKLGNLRRMRRSYDHHVSGCCTAIRRGLLEALLPIPPAFKGHDAWLHNMAGLLELRSVLDVPLIYYRRHGENVSRSASVSPIPVTQLRGAMSSLVAKLRQASPRLHHAQLMALEERWRAVDDRLAFIRSRSRQRFSVSDETLANARSIAHRRQHQAQQRLRILEVPRSRRWWAVLAASFHGTYAGFHIPGSIMMDLLAAAPGPKDADLGPRPGERAP